MLIVLPLNSRPVYCLNDRFLTINSHKYEVIGTEVTGPGVYDCIHTLKNLQTGAYTDVKMTDLLAKISSYNELPELKIK